MTLLDQKAKCADIMVVVIGIFTIQKAKSDMKVLLEIRGRDSRVILNIDKILVSKGNGLMTIPDFMRITLISEDQYIGKITVPIIILTGPMILTLCILQTHRDVHSEVRIVYSEVMVV
jgi:hypothetical protein